MNPQAPQLPAHHVSPGLKFVLFLFAVVVVGALGYFTWMVNGETTDTEENAPKVKDKTEETSGGAALGAPIIACGNKAYGYQLALGAKWADVKIKEYKPTDNSAIIHCYFGLPTTSTDGVWTTVAQDHEAGYASIFAVSVYTPAQWTVAKTEPNASTELDSNASYVWAWGSAQALPEDLQASKIADDVKNVVATFQIAP